MSARVNEALHRLSNPLRRVEYILAREGYGGEESDKLDDMELLLDVMEAREGLANAESPDEVAEIRTANDGKRPALIVCPVSKALCSQDARDLARNRAARWGQRLGGCPNGSDQAEVSARH